MVLLDESGKKCRNKNSYFDSFGRRKSHQYMIDRPMIQYTKNHVLIDCQQNKKAPTFVFCIPKIASSSVLEQSTHGPNSMYRLRIPIENAFAMHRRNDPFAIIAIDRGHKYANAVLPNRHQDGPCMFAENGQTLIIEWSPSPEGPQGAINSHSFPTIKAWARVEV